MLAQWVAIKMSFENYVVSNLIGHVNVLIAVLIEAFLLFVSLSAAGWLVERVSRRADRIMLCFMTLILVVFGVLLALTGIREFLFLG